MSPAEYESVPVLTMRATADTANGNNVSARASQNKRRPLRNPGDGVGSGGDAAARGIVDVGAAIDGAYLSTVEERKTDTTPSGPDRPARPSRPTRSHTTGRGGGCRGSGRSEAPGRLLRRRSQPLVRSLARRAMASHPRSGVGPCRLRANDSGMASAGRKRARGTLDVSSVAAPVPSPIHGRDTTDEPMATRTATRAVVPQGGA